MNIKTLSDADLYKLCREYGAAARLWRQKFIGLLPEVFERKLYIKKGFGSIFEFAAKLGGISEEQVRVVLNLEKRFEAMPVLKSLLVNGDVSINKLVRVASIANPENQEALAEQVKILPSRAIETLVRDEKFLHVHSNLQQNLENANSRNELKFSEEVTSKLMELREKGIDINILLLDLLKKRELEIAQKKEELSVKTELTESRYIPAKVRAVIKEEFGEKCSIKHCQKQAKVIHHTQRFSLSQTHDPKFLAPLCGQHHVIAHNIDRKFLNVRKKILDG